MIVGAMRSAGGAQVSSSYLWLTYLLHTIGELCLSPVGLSAMTKLAPSRVVGLMMGVWFLAASVGNYIGGRLASVYGALTPPTLFTIVAVFCIVFGLIMAAFVKPMKNLMGGVK
jgi:POT family proton-dependent oligopeptide transporter